MPRDQRPPWRNLADALRKVLQRVLLGCCKGFTRDSVFEIELVHCAGKEQMLHMAEALAKLPARVLWRLTPKEVPDQAAIEALRLGNNTKVGPEATPKLTALLPYRK